MGGADARPAPARSGADADAIGRLCDRTAPDLYALALRIIGGAGEAEEVVEQALLEAWTARGDAETHATLLVRRCRSLALVRSGKRSIESTRRSPSLAEPHPLDDRARAAAARALGRLGEGELRLVAMAYFEGYSVVEIAARTGAAPHEVLAGLARILGMLQEEDGATAAHAPGAMEPEGFEDACVLYAFDLLEGAEHERMVRLRPGDPALVARLAARERSAALLALSAPPSRPGPDLRARLVRAVAGATRA